MRNEVLRLAMTRSADERRKRVRAAIRQLERAELYFDAVDLMDVADRETARALNQLRADLRSLTAQLVRSRPFDAE